MIEVIASGSFAAHYGDIYFREAQINARDCIPFNLIVRVKIFEVYFHLLAYFINLNFCIGIFDSNLVSHELSLFFSLRVRVDDPVFF